MVGDSDRPSRPSAASVASFFMETRCVVVGLALCGVCELWQTIVVNIRNGWRSMGVKRCVGLGCSVAEGLEWVARKHVQTNAFGKSCGASCFGPPCSSPSLSSCPFTVCALCCNKAVIFPGEINPTHDSSRCVFLRR